MFDSRRTPRPAPPLPVVLSILVLFALASPARGEVPECCNGGDPSACPPESDTICAESNFLLCGNPGRAFTDLVPNPYALCYYSGPKTEILSNVVDGRGQAAFS